MLLNTIIEHDVVAMMMMIVDNVVLSTIMIKTLHNMACSLGIATGDSKY